MDDAVKDGVAVIAALRLAADQARAAGDGRNRGQVMADTLVGRVTGRDPLTEPAPVSVDVTVPLDALLPDGSHHAQVREAFGWVDGYGEVPADLARSLIADAVESMGPLATFRRIFTDPVTGQLVAVESTARVFPTRSRARSRALVKVGERLTGSRPAYTASQARPCARSTCPASRTLVPRARGGANYAKQAPGWRSKTCTDPDGTHVVETTTPTGHTYETRPPPAHPPRPPNR